MTPRLSASPAPDSSWLSRVAYDCALTLLGPAFLVAGRVRGRYRESFWTRLGLTNFDAAEPGGLLVHMASVGEALAAAPLVRALRRAHPRLPITVTTLTETGQATAGREFEGHDVHATYLPIDTPFAVRRFLERVRPAVLVLVETELWPNLIRIARELGASVVLVNGRLSDRSFPRYRTFRRHLAPLLRKFDLLAMRSAEDLARIVDLGADPRNTLLVGDLKWDRVRELAWQPLLRDPARFGLAAAVSPRDEFRLVLGSIHNDELPLVMNTLSRVRERARHLRVIVAPRKIDRIDELVRDLADWGWKPVRVSKLRAQARVAAQEETPVLDTIGELTALYAVAHAVVVGGSWNGHGGQNPLEPAAMGHAPLVGPSMENFRDAVSWLRDRGGIESLRDGEELFGRVSAVVADPVPLRRRGLEVRARLATLPSPTRRLVRLLETRLPLDKTPDFP